MTARPAGPDGAAEGAGPGSDKRILPISYPVRPDPFLVMPPERGGSEAERARYRRRRRRLHRWRRPIVDWHDRLRAWTNMLLVDHGFIRALYPNFWRVTPSMWRSAQPLPHHIARFARAGGRTVVSLRGGQSFGSLPLEVEACERHGLAFHVIILRSRDLPEVDELIRILDVLARLDRPVLFHCKSGADRAGFMAALWLLVVEGRPLDEARAQLSLRYGHFAHAKTGILDAFFEAYARDGGPEAIPFRNWVATRYDRAAIRSGFRAGGLHSLLSDRLLGRE
ncbi:MAG: tyrosine-protein phosphatase [Pseudomonadota bacterium]